MTTFCQKCKEGPLPSPCRDCASDIRRRQRARRRHREGKEPTTSNHVLRGAPRARCWSLKVALQICVRLPLRSGTFPGLFFGWADRRRTHPLRMAVTPWTQRVAASNNSEFMFSKHGTRICTRQQVRTGDSVSDRAHSIAGRRDHERSSLLSPSLTSGHGTQHTGLPPRLCSCGRTTTNA